MVQYLESNQVMKITQHGFRHKSSTISQILSFCKKIISKLEKEMMMMPPN